jgi:hypothetical protein
MWALQIALVATLSSVLIALGPVIRRIGVPLIDDVFYLNRATGERFSRLLDIAYYLVFGGGILLSLDLVSPSDRVAVGSEAFASLVFEAANYLLLLGLAHVANLLALPVVGLFYSATVRRARRQVAGLGVPDEAAAARSADRIVTWATVALALITIAVVLALVGFAILSS